MHEFWERGEPLKNQNGEAYAIFNRDNVWIRYRKFPRNHSYAILTLYFANAEGTDLVAEERVVEVSKPDQRKTVLEQLIAGPEEKAVLQRFLSVQKSRM